jgi:hypothetical protein
MRQIPERRKRRNWRKGEERGIDEEKRKRGRFVLAQAACGQSVAQK